MTQEDKDNENWAVEFWEGEFLRTGNPIYVWKAIHSLNVAETQRAAKQGVPALLPPEIPTWCVRYLVDVASRMYDLSLGLDEAQRPKDSDEFSAWVAWGGKPTLRPREAARRLPNALRLDWKAFTSFQRTERAALADYIYRVKRLEGLSARDATDLVMQKLGVENERTLRRYFAEARQRGVKPPP
jgi:hypothetical protein